MEIRKTKKKRKASDQIGDEGLVERRKLEVTMESKRTCLVLACLTSSLIWPFAGFRSIAERMCRAPNRYRKTV